MPSQQQVLSLYKQMLRHSTKFDNYNFKHYFIRRTRDQFKQAKELKDEQQIAQMYAKALQDSSVLERQSKISQMYSFEKLVVEPLASHH